MLHFEKAVACVVQDGALLCFRHPFAGNQIPKGTLEPGERLEDAVIRELAEESGVEYEDVPQPIGTLERVAAGGHRHDGPLESQRWHLFLMPMDGLAATWSHRAIGSAVEDGLIFELFWQPLDEKPEGFADAFVEVIDRVRAAVENNASAKRR